VTVRRIGFAYNPTIEATVELAARASGWCRRRGIDEWRAQAGDSEALAAELPTTDALVVRTQRRHIPPRRKRTAPK